MGSTPGLGQSSGRGNGKPFQNSCLENPKDCKNLVGYSSYGCKRVGHDWASAHRHTQKGINGQFLVKMHRRKNDHPHFCVYLSILGIGFSQGN